MKRDIKTIVKMYGCFLSPLLIGLMAFTFMLAYLTPEKAIILTIDTVGEANIEFALLFVILPTVLYTSWSHFKSLYFYHVNI